MKTLNLKELENLKAGTFCQGFGVVAAGYQVGVLCNLWNPIGWGGEAALCLVGVYCLTR